MIIIAFGKIICYNIYTLNYQKSIFEGNYDRILQRNPAS